MRKLTRSQWLWLGALAVVLALVQINQPYPEIAGDMADDYNGQQGDIWDAQKDMAMAMLGVLAGIAWTALRKRS